MGSAGNTTRGEDGADNVIPFPGSSQHWFGSEDDLVPFGPSADRIRAERAKRSAEQASAGDAATDPPPKLEVVPDEDIPVLGGGDTPISRLGADIEEPDLAGVLSADDFWGADSGALHQALDRGPDPVATSGDAVEAPRATRHAINPGFRGVPSRGLLLRGAALLAIAACLVLAGLGTIVGSGSNHRTASNSAMTQSSSPAGTPTTPGLDAAAQARAVGIDTLRRRAQASAARRSATVHSHRRSRPVAHRVRPARHASPSPSPSPVRSENVSAPIQSSPKSEEAAEVGDTDSSYSSAASSSTPATSSTSNTSSGNSSTAGMLGGVVGSSCDPTCR